MSWIDYTTLVISAGTFLIVVVNTIFNIRARRKDRSITVFLEERRKMHNELFNHITGILNIGLKSIDVEDFTKRQELKREILNHKIFIWVNLNKENEIANELRSNCNEYVFWCASVLEKDFKDQEESYLLSANRNAQHIWVLIDKYIEKENELREKMI